MTAELTDVRFVALPVPLHFRARQHLDELQRELLYVAAEPGTVPVRLGELSRHITTRFASFIGGPQRELDAAHDAGVPTIDLVYQMPPEAAPVARQANAMLDEVQEFCREGGLLALAAEHEVVAYRRWYFEQFSAQIEGAPPVPWPDWPHR